MQKTPHDSINDALRQVVQDAGGAKAVGARMYPALPVARSQQRVNDSLNSEHAQHFNELEILWLLKLGRECGWPKRAMLFIATDCAYSAPEPVETPDEREQLQRDFIAAAAQLKQMSVRLEAITARATLQAVR